MVLSRRAFLSHAAIAAGLGVLPVRLALADAAGDRRLVVVLLRGGMDGLAAVPPVGDRYYKEIRRDLAVAPAAQLDGRFGLHPALEPLAPWYQAGEMLVLHAVASPYRERSHFDAQDIMESGAARTGGRRDGWLNRTVGLLGGGERRLGLALGQSTPLILRGDAPVMAWSPSPIPEAHDGFLTLVGGLYRNDSLFAEALAQGLETDAAVAEAMDGRPVRGRARGNGRALFQAAGRMLAEADGPRIAALELPGWDTHVGQGAEQGRLANALGRLAGNLVALRDALGPAWRDTVTVVVTEFGRTAAPNGSGGTDHGTATAALVLGGRVSGGRVIADWPGLGRLHENRDLAPTTDLRAVLKGVLRDQFALPPDALDRVVFPDSAGVPALPELLGA